MSIPEINCCPSTLRQGFTTYSPMAQQYLFGNRRKKVSHILPFATPGKNNEQTKQYNEKRKRISISGVQEKYSLRLEKNDLTLTDTDGTHIIKPVPTERLLMVEDLPANEHVTMQIAKQVFGLNTADCGLIFFEDGSPAYITRRFDYKEDGTGKYQVEDFATLLAKSPERDGEDFKYNASYLDIARQIDQYASAALIVKREFFRLIIFNYLIANGDAHLKNFSLIETKQGDFILSPAYDLLCTDLHIGDNRIALNEGLYPDDYQEETFSTHGTYTASSFIIFGEKIGLRTAMAEAEVARFIAGIDSAIELLNRSFLSKDGKEKYVSVMMDRKKSLLLAGL